MSFKSPQPGASLLLAFSPPPNSQARRTILLISPVPTRLSSVRAFAALEAGYKVIVACHLAPDSDSEYQGWDGEMVHRVKEGQVTAVPFELPVTATAEEWNQFLLSDSGLEWDEIAFVLLHDTLLTLPAGKRREKQSTEAFVDWTRQRRIPVSVADEPTLSDFTFPTTHRFPASSSAATGAERSSPLQMALTTNASSCALAARLKRELVAALPANVGEAVEKIAQLRKEVKDNMGLVVPVEEGEEDEGEEERGLELNRPAVQRGMGRCRAGSRGRPREAQTRDRLRYIAQISNYYPLSSIPSLSLSSLADSSAPLLPPLPSEDVRPTHHSLSPTRFCRPLPNGNGTTTTAKKNLGRAEVYLLGTGPGSPLLLTRMTHLFLTCTDPSSPFYIDLFLSDKLVPSPILDLIPSSRRHHPTEGDCVIIARKFPGNAEASQEELYGFAFAALGEGKRVARLKQGDPLIFGRVGEEVLRFRAAGYEPLLVPGTSAAVAGAGTAGLMLTMRGVSGGLTIGTGVGRGGKGEKMEVYERNKTRVLLMGVARLKEVIAFMISPEGGGYPAHLPVAIVERASLADQRVISTTLDRIVGVMDRVGEHRPPAMMVVGWSVLALEARGGKGDEDVLRATGEQRTEEEDKKVVDGWVGERGYRVKEGMPEMWNRLERSIKETGMML